MYSAFSQKLDNLQLMSSIERSYETSPAQNSSAKVIIPSKTKHLDNTRLLPLEEEGSGGMGSRMEHQSVPVTTTGGEVKMVTPIQAQTYGAKANIRKEYKHSKGKLHICGKGSGGKSKSKQQTKGKAKAGKNKSQNKGKKQVSGKSNKKPPKKAQSTKKKGTRKTAGSKNKGKKVNKGKKSSAAKTKAKGKK